MSDVQADFHRDLPAGTILVHAFAKGPVRIRLSADMRGEWAAVERIRANGETDRRCVGWSGSLPRTSWTVQEMAGGGA